MSKKILSVVLALVLMMTIAVPAFAGVSFEDPEADVTYTQAWALGEPVDNGDGTWTVAVKLTANYNVMSIGFEISNTDNTNAVLSNAVAGADIPADWNATVTKNNTTGQVAINPNPSDDAVDALDCSTEKEIAVLTYTVAANKSADIAIVNDAKTATNPGGTLIAARSSNNNVVTDGANPVVGQTVTSVGETRTLGSVATAKPELVINDTNVVLNTGITCSGTYAGALMGFAGTAFTSTAATTIYPTALSASNGGSLKYVVSPGTGRNRYGTGATVQLLDTDGTTVLATYAIIIFGDTNGDGLINSTDMKNIANHTNGTSTFTAGTLEYYAASGADGSPRQINIVAGDRTAILKHANGSATLNQATIATKYTSVSC